MTYLPAKATVADSCDWLKAKTGEVWTLPRLLESGLMPWFWFDYAPGWPDIFRGRTEGYLAPMCFAGDTDRLAAGSSDVVVTMTRTQDGIPVIVSPTWRISIDELRFIKSDIETLVAPAQEREIISGKAPIPRMQAQEEEIIAKLKELGYSPEALPKNESGKPGVKARVKEALGKKGMWAKTTVFDKAWERLSANKQIKCKE